MSAWREEAGGTLVYECARYRLEALPARARATLSAPDGEQLAALRLIAALDTAAAPDETLALEAPVVDGATATFPRRSTVWEAAATALVCGEDTIEVRTSVAGHGELADVQLLGGRSLVPGTPTGFVPSGSRFRTLFSPGPSEPPRLVRPASEAALLGVVGDGSPGRGRWFFTPPPLLFALTTAPEVGDSLEAGWTTLGLAAPVDELSFPQLAFVPADGGFHLRLEYEGHTRVDGAFDAPAVLVTPGVPDPYTGIRRHRDDLAARGAAPPVTPRETPAWWSEPIFCGWGAQCNLVRGSGRFAGEAATQESYDRFLAELEAEGLVPGTVVLDDKWQAAYGTNEPDAGKWPDLGAWIARRHAHGQHVLLWWKAWDAEGLPPELCVRNPDGHPVALDPGNPAAREALAASVRHMLGPDGLDADGLKIDFTARTPSGRALTAHGPGWGIALLHELLAVVYGAAKEAKPDALVMTHTPHPAFVDVTDMVRLNDMSRPGEGELPVTGQMLQRAAVAAAACPELLIDTDDWCAPDLETWREYAALKPGIGVPSLYYTTHLDATGEALAAEDYETLRRTWAQWREEGWRRPA
jgi:hypothetical protein